MTGPSHLHPSLATKLESINKLRDSFPDAQLREDVEDFPAPPLGAGPSGQADSQMPAKKDMVKWGLKTVARQLLKQPSADSLERPQGYLAHVDNRWFRTAQFDSVVVSNAEGTAASWYKRDPRKLKEMLKESALQHAALYRNWDSLAADYRSALTDLVSMEAWRVSFDMGQETNLHH